LCARAGGRIISLHSRGASGAILDALEAYSSAGIFILHWYLGTMRQIARAAEMGCWFSVGPSMLSSARGSAALAAMPRERVLPETDGPFGLVMDHPAYPWDAWSIVPHLAEVWKETPHDAGIRLLRNFRALL
jgi:TatD DNase family protein